MVRNLTAELVIELSTVLGECPRWSPADQALHVLDIDQRDLLSIDVREPRVTGRTRLDASVTAHAESTTKHWIASTETGIAWLEPSSGSVDEFLSITDPAIAKMNDGGVDPLGRFWVGSTSLDRSRRNGSLFMVDGDLHAHTMISSVGMSNGLGWLNEGRTLVHVDTLSMTVSVFDVVDTAVGWRLRNPKRIVELRPKDGLPDGLAIDESGAIWLALWGSGQVRRYTPKGKLDTVISTQARNTTSCAFGDSNLETLFITSARKGLVDPGKPDGGLFAVTPGVRGIDVSQPFRTSSAAPAA